MACGCKKNRTRPLSKTTIQNTSGKSTTVDNTAAGIRARKAQGQTQSFRLDTRDGRTQVFGSLLEAKAARVRAGGGTIN